MFLLFWRALGTTCSASASSVCQEARWFSGSHPGASYSLRLPPVNPCLIIEFRYSSWRRYRSWMQVNRFLMDFWNWCRAFWTCLESSNFPCARPRCCPRRQKNACDWKRFRTCRGFLSPICPSTFVPRQLIEKISTFALGSSWFCMCIA